MHPRRDGEGTRHRILEGACRVFAEHGYREATIAEICRVAKANIAAVNYHFGSKAALYRAAWQRGIAKADDLYPLDGGVPDSAPPEDRLRGLVTSLIHRRSDHEHLGHFRRIRMSEMVEPTGLLTEFMNEHLARGRRHAHCVLGALLGPRACQRDLELSEMSLIGQCFYRPSCPDRSPVAASLPRFDDPQESIEHIVRFTLAGLAEVRRVIERRHE
jgi:TetR/AcrR family transcriptional regulator, regulator of cefoperazone and chloramphenicol sensitivity